MTGSPIIKKVPGKVPRFPNEKDGYVCLTQLPKVELLDLLSRERKILDNKRFLEKLPDKGEKITKLYRRVEEELRKREEHENLCDLLSTLNVYDSKNAIDQIEWTGKYDDKSDAKFGEENQINPFEILASHSGTDVSKQINVKVEQPTQSTELAAENPPVDSVVVDAYARQLCNRFGTSKTHEGRKAFYTHRSLNKKSVKEIIEHAKPVVSSRGDTNSTGATKMLTLQESMAIQQDQTRTLKEIQLRHAIEKLQEKTSLTIGNPNSDISGYREPTNDSDEETESVISNAESEEDNTDTAIFYNLVDDTNEDDHR